ncbi:MAG: DUF624 domain-containing protein [Clostridia bacterium]|nr:DUF624 domain-containing protein [Clostridia bacterium]
MGLLFNYNKEGPGVSKNQPEKKDFWRFFELLGRNFKNLVLANLWTALLSLPVVTVGLGQVGLTFITRTISHDRHLFLTSDYFETVKKNWKQGLAISIIDLMFIIILACDIYFFYLLSDSLVGVVGLVFSLIVALLFIFSGYYRYVLAITFNFSIVQIYKNSFLLAICGFVRNLITTLCLLVLYLIVFGIGWIMGGLGFLVLFLLFLFFVPALRSFIIQFTIFPVVLKYVIEPYYAEHPDEDIEKRRELGLLPYASPDEDVDWGE